MTEAIPRWVSPRPDELNAAQQALRAHILSGPRNTQAADAPLVDADGSLLGPFGLMLISPPVGAAVQEIGSALRFRTVLSAEVREAAILLVAAHRHCSFEWFSHAPLAAKAGITETQLEALHRGQMPGGLGRDTTTALHIIERLLDGNTLDERQYSEAVTELGEEPLVELVWLCGYYTMLALALAVFQPASPTD